MTRAMLTRGPQHIGPPALQKNGSQAASNPGRAVDRLSWLWLAIGAILLPLTAWQTVLPLAAWLAPILLMRFVRTQRAAVGLPVVAIVSSAAVIIAFRNELVPAPAPIAQLIAVGYGIAFSLAYVVDRLLAPRLHGVARTLVFPLAATAVSWLVSIAPGTYATWGSPAYSQVDNLALVQLVSVTGLWGLTFLISWLAPVANEAWEHRFAWRSVRSSAVPFASVLLAVLLFGSVRLAFSSSESPTVRVAGLVADTAQAAMLEHNMLTIVKDIPGQVPVWVKLAGGSDRLRAMARAQFTPILDDLFERTRREARAGAKIVVWSEEAAQILQEDEPLVIERAVALARDEGIYLQMGWLVSLHTEQFPYIQNRALLVDPSGALVWDYAKSHPVPGGETFLFGPGEGIVPNVTTPYGVLATVICFDMNYPTTVRQTGQAATDVLLAPSRDWAAIKVTHAQMHAFRAIENGVSVVRPTENGVGLAVDPMGRILAAQDSFATDKPALVAAVPTRGVATVYARVGDSFAYMSIAALVLLIGGAFVRGRVLRVAAAPAATFGAHRG